MNDQALSFAAAATFDLGIPLWLYALLFPVLIALMALDYRLSDACEKAFDKKQAAKRRNGR